MELFADTWRYLIEADSWTGSGGLVARLLEQLLLTVTALVAAILLGLPLALWLGHLGRGGFLAVNISNVGRAVPTFALLALLVAADWPGSGDFGPSGRAGLATLIAHGVQRDFRAELLTAAVLCVVLAVVLDVLLVLLQRVLTPWTATVR